jgi:hypothetical protein
MEAAALIGKSFRARRVDLALTVIGARLTVPSRSLICADAFASTPRAFFLWLSMQPGANPYARVQAPATS